MPHSLKFFQYAYIKSFQLLFLLNFIISFSLQSLQIYSLRVGMLATTCQYSLTIFKNKIKEKKLNVSSIISFHDNYIPLNYHLVLVLIALPTEILLWNLKMKGIWPLLLVKLELKTTQEAPVMRYTP